MRHTSRRSSAPSPEPTFTADDLLASLLARPAGDGEGLTSWELAEKMGVSIKTALQRLRPLHRAGKLVLGTRFEMALNGRTQPVPTYRLKG